MSTQHTPAPWTTDGDAYSGNLDIIALTGRIAMLDCEFSAETEDVLTANARLIAAAPDLLAALQRALAAIEYYHAREGSPETLADARAAIAKATGGGQ
jgi:hypothetical protein